MGMRPFSWKPTVGKRWLLVLAGGSWMAAGIVLGAFAFSWLRPLPRGVSLPLALGGGAIAVIAYRLGFITLAIRNIRRIQHMPDRGHILSFMQPKGYLMIGFMATAG